MKKVYCQECVFLKEYQFKGAEGIIWHDCIYIDNIEYLSNWLNQDIKENPKQKPWQMNKNNNCKWYKEK